MGGGLGEGGGGVMIPPDGGGMMPADGGMMPGAQGDGMVSTPSAAQLNRQAMGFNSIFADAVVRLLTQRSSPPG